MCVSDEGINEAVKVMRGGSDLTWRYLHNIASSKNPRCLPLVLLLLLFSSVLFAFLGYILWLYLFFPSIRVLSTINLLFFTALYTFLCFLLPLRT